MARVHPRELEVEEQEVGTGRRRLVRIGAAAESTSQTSSSLSVFLCALKEKLDVQLRDVFLPIGYPGSVEDGYLEYQVWDLVQGLTSYLRSNLAMKELLVGLGVGDVAASASASALASIILNGSSMVGSLVFTWRSAREFGFHVRQWRLFADVINDVGLTLNMLAPLFGKRWFLWIAAGGSVCTAMCSVAAGATKPSISQFFARDNNLSDLCAKEGSQETIVNLAGLVGGYVFLSVLSDGRPQVVWTAFALLTVLHVVANIFAVRTLRFREINECRFRIVFDRFRDHLLACKTGREASSSGAGMGVATVADAEPLLPAFVRLPGCCGGGRAVRGTVELGARAPAGPAYDVVACFRRAEAAGRMYAVNLASSRHATMFLHPSATAEDMIRGRFCAERRLSLLAANGGTEDGAGREEEDDECNTFIEALRSHGWDLSRHALDVGGWRYTWSKEHGC